MMRNIYQRTLTGIIATACIFLLLAAVSCQNDSEILENDENGLPEPVEVDLQAIKDRGVLRAITSYSSTSYFVYRGRPMGYEYELLEKLALELGVELEIIVADDLDSLFHMLNRGDGDIIAHNLTITKSRKELIDFTKSHTTTKQVLVQRRPENWRQMNPMKVEKMMVRSPLDLPGKPIYIRQNSSYRERLVNLSNEIGEDLDIIPVPGKKTTGEIIRDVSKGIYEYTVADQNIAMINGTYLDNIDIKTEISLPQSIAWGVRKSSPELLNAINTWIGEMQQDAVYYVIYNKYFKNKKAFVRRVKSDFYSKKGGKISKYDDSVKDYAEELDMDWRLLSAQIYQESRFDPTLQSWAGAKGLMQVMPATARSYGISNLFDAESSLRAGTRYLAYLQKYWKEIPDSTQRQKFVLGSYNAGPGHVEDARRLTDKYGGDSNDWGDVSGYLLLKAKREYYTDDVVKFGYCRGSEPVRYVRQILKRFKHYSQFIEEGERHEVPPTAITST